MVTFVSSLRWKMHVRIRNTFKREKEDFALTSTFPIAPSPRSVIAPSKGVYEHGRKTFCPNGHTSLTSR